MSARDASASTLDGEGRTGAAEAKRVRLSLDASVDAVVAEVEHAVTAFGSDYASAHEAFGVLLEEVDEFRAWVYRKRNERDRRAMMEELTQIAAVAVKYRAQLERAAADAAKPAPIDPVSCEAQGHRSCK